MLKLDDVEAKKVFFLIFSKFLVLNFRLLHPEGRSTVVVIAGCSFNVKLWVVFEVVFLLENTRDVLSVIYEPENIKILSFI